MVVYIKIKLLWLLWIQSFQLSGIQYSLCFTRTLTNFLSSIKSPPQCLPSWDSVFTVAGNTESRKVKHRTVINHLFRGRDIINHNYNSSLSDWFLHKEKLLELVSQWSVLSLKINLIQMLKILNKAKMANKIKRIY